MSLGLSYQVFGFDLIDEINSKFQGIYNGGFADEYLSRTYSSNYSKDPFGDEMSNIVDRSNQLKIAGVQYVKKVLDAGGCSLSDKKIRGILYYFVPEFRMDLARDLKMEMGDYDSKKYEVSEKDVNKYCKEYFSCVESKAYTAWEIFKNMYTYTGEDGNRITVDMKSRPLTYGDPLNMETNCKEFFQTTYEAGKYNELIKQNAQTSRMGADKYWNRTTDDSPYDVMEDMGILAKLLYQEAEDPITPVFYDIPAFSNSKNNLRDGKDYDNSGNKEVDDNKESEEGPDKPSLGGGDDPSGPDNPGGQIDPEKGGNVGESPTKPIQSSDFVMMDEYDNLVDGLGGLSLNGNSTFSNLCDNRESSESELENDKKEKNVKTYEPARTIDEMSEKDYQELVDYMLDAVDKVGELSDEKSKEIDKEIGDKEDFGGEGVARLRERAEQVKKCYDSCKGLRIDQKASCMVKCSCGEITSADDKIFGKKNKLKLFDSDEFPGLGPILIIKFCAVPAVDTKFSVGGKRIHSIEEGIKEIYGVVDKLSREGLLGKWTQQYEFLDSSTKQMNFAETFAFTIDVEFVNIANKMPKHSDQYKDKELKNDNEAAQEAYGILNSLNNPVTKNANSAIKNSNGENSDYGDSANIGTNNDAQGELNTKPKPFMDLFVNAYADLHGEVESYWDLWLNQQGELWLNAEDYIDNLKSSATFLNGRKSKCKK